MINNIMKVNKKKFKEFSNIPNYTISSNMKNDT